MTEGTKRPLENDRDLLNHLELKDTLAAAYLGKTRQALNTKLGPKSATSSPDNYFSCSELFILFSAAHKRGVAFDADRMSKYIQRTRTPSSNAEQIAYDHVMSFLEPATHLDLDEVYAVAFVLPAFDKIRELHEPRAQELRKIVKTLTKSNRRVELFCVSSTETQAQLAAGWLGIAGHERSVGKYLVDHYSPMVLFYLYDQEVPMAQILTEKVGLVDALHFRGDMIRTCVHSMLSEQQIKDIHAASERTAIPVTPPEPVLAGSNP